MIEQSTPTQNCPSPSRWKAFCVGSLSEHELEQLVAHLDQCSDCRGQLQGINDLSDPLLMELKNEPSGENFTHEPECHQAIQQFEVFPTFGTSGPLLDIKKAEQLIGSLERYRLLRHLGSGSMGHVFLVQDQLLDRPVALKLARSLPSAPAELKRQFFHEAQLAASLSHPNLCPVLDVGESGGVPYLTMTFLNGEPLSALLKTRPWNEISAATVVSKVARGLAEVHRSGMIHRDLKLSNIILLPQGEPVITDFGLARLVTTDPEQNEVGAIVGTPAYLAPELVASPPAPASPLSDIYSLGVVLYQLLTGELPVQGSVRTILKQLTLPQYSPPAELLPEINVHLGVICRKAMAPHPSDRFPTAVALAEALEQFVARSSSNSEWGNLSFSKSKWTAAMLIPVLVMACILWSTLHKEPDWGSIHLQLDGELEDISIFLDGQLMEVKHIKESVKLVPGAHTVAMTSEEFEPIEKQIVVRAGEQVAVPLIRIPLKPLVIAKADQLLEGHEEGVAQISICTETKQLLSAGNDHTIRLWDLTLGTQLANLTGHGAGATDVAFLPGNTTGISSGRDKSVRIWELPTQQEIACLEHHTDQVKAILILPDAKHVATAGWDRVIRIWNLQTQTQAMAWEEHLEGITCLALSPDGLILASGSYDRTVRLWKVATGELMRVLVGHPSWLRSLCFSHNGQFLIATSRHPEVFVWSVVDGLLTNRFTHHSNWVNASCTLPNSTLVLTGSRDCTIRLWDYRNGREKAVFQGHADAVTDLALMEDIGQFASCSMDRTIRIWSIPETIQPHSEIPLGNINAHNR